MRSLAHEAGYKALDEVKEGRTVAILFPKGFGAVIFEMGPTPEGITSFIDGREEELQGVTFDTLITVKPEKIEDRTLALARLRLSRAEEPRTFDFPGMY